MLKNPAPQDQPHENMSLQPIRCQWKENMDPNPSKMTVIKLPHIQPRYHTWVRSPFIPPPPPLVSFGFGCLFLYKLLSPHEPLVSDIMCVYGQLNVQECLPHGTECWVMHLQGGLRHVADGYAIGDDCAETDMSTQGKVDRWKTLVQGLQLVQICPYLKKTCMYCF